MSKDDFVIPDRKIKHPKFDYVSEKYEVVHSIEASAGVRIDVVYGDNFEYVLFSDNGDVLEYSNCGYGSFLLALRDGLTAIIERY